MHGKHCVNNKSVLSYGNLILRQRHYFLYFAQLMLCKSHFGFFATRSQYKKKENWKKKQKTKKTINTHTTKLFSSKYLYNIS